MPSEKMKFLPKNELLTFEELGLLVRKFIDLGVSKIRITGGEPFVRKDLIYFLKDLRKNHPDVTLAITSNGVLLGKYLNDLRSIGIEQINLSLDTLDPGRFLRITARDDFEKVQKCLFDLIESGFKTKVNFVVMKGVNDDEIIPFSELAKDFPVQVRFIEEMPFNGLGKQRGFIDHEAIKDTLRSHWGSMDFNDHEIGSSSFNTSPIGFQGSIGVIPAFTRTFCGSCNRIRISAIGRVKTCLYGKDELDLRYLLRNGKEAEIERAINQSYSKRPENGLEAEKHTKLTSMSLIGG